MSIRKDKTELMVGLFVFFGLAIMGALIVQFGRFSDRLRDKYEIQVVFPDASGIRPGSPVNLAGQKIGFVDKEPKLNADFTGVTVFLSVYSGNFIPVGSDFSIGTSGLMGDTFIKVDMPEDPKPVYLKDGAEVAGGESTGLEALQDDAGVVLGEINVAVKDIQAAVKSLNRVFEKIENGMLSDENLENLKTSFAELRETTETLNTSTKKIDPLMVEAKATVVEAKTAMTKAGETFDKAKEVIGKAEPALEELTPTIAELKSTLKNANAAITKMTEGGGVTAALISDSGLRSDLESFLDKLERHGILGYPKEKKSSSSKPSQPRSTGPPGRGLFNRNR